MCQLDLFGATSGCQQVIYKERDNEKEKSPHTPLKEKKQRKKLPPSSSPAYPRRLPHRARARAYARVGKG